MKILLCWKFEKYENFIVLGDFNTEKSNPHMREFCALYNFINLIKEPKCYKNVDKPTSIDYILTIMQDGFNILVFIKRNYLIFID